MTEDQLLENVIDLAHAYGWRVAHFRPAKTERGWRTAVQGDGAGFPDLLAVRVDRLVVMEFKSDKGRTTPEQQAWLEALYPFAWRCGVFRPSDWPQAIKALLR